MLWYFHLGMDAWTFIHPFIHEAPFEMMTFYLLLCHPMIHTSMLSYRISHSVKNSNLMLWGPNLGMLLLVKLSSCNSSWLFVVDEQAKASKGPQTIVKHSDYNFNYLMSTYGCHQVDPNSLRSTLQHPKLQQAPLLSWIIPLLQLTHLPMPRGSRTHEVQMLEQNPLCFICLFGSKRIQKVD